MLLRSPASLLFVVLVACHAAPPPESPSRDLEQAHAALEHQVQWLVSMLAQKTSEPLASQPESAGITEIAARLATLNERLDDLIVRLPALAIGTGAVDATSQRTATAPRPDAADTTGIEMLQQALLLVEQQRNLCIENISNVNTAGYKRRSLVMTTALHPASGLQVPVAGRAVPIHTTGTLEITERTLDVAIDGDGFLVVTAPDGTTRYTRDGSFQIDVLGQIVTGAGCPLAPTITVPNDLLEISIDGMGRVSGRTASDPDTATTFGQLQLARFVDASHLEPAGQSTLQPTAAAGQPIVGRPGSIGFGMLKQSFVERSNVQVINELMNLQAAERQRTLLRRVLAGYGIYVR